MLTVLNPALHSRIFYKEALTLAQVGYAVGVAGQSEVAQAYTQHNVWVFPHRRFSRLSPLRLVAPLRLLALAWRVRPRIATLHTPELLLIGMLLKIRGIKVVYDVHEDYFANFKAGQGAPLGLGWLIGGALRLKERICVPLLDGVILAEGKFEALRLTTSRKLVVVRNVFNNLAGATSTTLIHNPPEALSHPIPMLLHTGTLSREWGVERAIALWKSLNGLGPVNLCLVGHCANEGYLQHILRLVNESGFEPRFTLVGGSHYVDYPTVISYINRCTLGLALYQPLPHFASREPTKFFEFHAAGKPLLFTPIPEWEALNNQLSIGISAKLVESECGIQQLYADLVTDLNRLGFPKKPSTHSPWEEEGKKLVAFYGRWLAGPAGNAS